MLFTRVNSPIDTSNLHAHPEWGGGVLENHKSICLLRSTGPDLHENHNPSQAAK